MSVLEEYNNQIILTINNAYPVNDNEAKEKGNSKRLFLTVPNVQQYYDCRNICYNNSDCSSFEFNNDDILCKLYRNEPYKDIKDTSLNNCKHMCSVDNNCDYLSHSSNNTCRLFTRENDIKNKAQTSIGDLWFDFSIYGFNDTDGTNAKNFYDCLNKMPEKNFVYYGNGQCIPKTFYKFSPGNTTIYFDKKPYNKYKSINKYIGLKSKNRNIIDKYKNYIVSVFLIILLLIIYYICKE